MSARLEHLAERSEREGIPGEATKVILYNNFKKELTNIYTNQYDTILYNDDILNNNEDVIR